MKALDLFAQMENYHMQWYNNLHPNTIVITNLLKVLANHSNPEEACHHLEIIMNKIEHDPNASSTYTLNEQTNSDIGLDYKNNEAKTQTLYKIHPDVTTYGMAIVIWDKLAMKQRKRNKPSRIDPTVKVQQHLQRLLALVKRAQKHHNSEYDTTLDYGQIMFYLNRAINVWLCSNAYNAPIQAQNILQLALEHPHLRPDQYSFAFVLKAWARSRREDGSKEAYTILKQMEDRYEEGKTDVSPDIFCYNNVMYAFCKRQQLEQAEKLISHMLSKCDQMEQEGKVGVRPDLTTFMTLMSAYVKRYERLPDGMKKLDTTTIPHLEKLYHQLEIMDEKYKKARYLDTMLLNIMIYAHARSYHEDRALKAVDILNRMERMYHSGKNKHVKPDLKTYTSVISSFKGYENAIERTNIILKRIEQQKLGTDAILRKAVLNNLASSDSQKADEYLLEMEEKGIQMDNTFYLTLIQAFTEENKPDSAHKAEMILKRMTDLYVKGNMDVFPNTSMFNTVLAAIAVDESPDFEERAENIVNKMEQISSWGMESVTPDATTFKTLIQIYERSKSGKKALEVLNHMEDLHKAGTFSTKPDHFTYKSVFNACIRDKDLNLNLVFNYAKRIMTNFPNILRVTDYHAVMFKYALNHQPDSVDKISELLSMLEERKVPLQSSYTILLKACQDTAYKLNFQTKNREEKANTIFRIASDTFKKIMESSHFEMTDLPFVTYISICMQVLPDDDQVGSQPSSKERVVTAIFQKACEQGLLSENVLKKIAPDSTLAAKLTGINSVGSAKATLNSLPTSWSCNVPLSKEKLT